jgi:hypothetical protein
MGMTVAVGFSVSGWDIGAGVGESGESGGSLGCINETFINRYFIYTTYTSKSQSGYGF